MFFVYLVSVLGLPTQKYEYYPELWYICNCSLDKKSSCSSEGVGTFSSLQGDTARPSVIYALDYASVVYTEEFCTDQLQLEPGSYVSGKITGIFTPKESGNYTFRSRVTHVLTTEYFFDLITSVLVDADIDEGSYKGAMSCSFYGASGCNYKGSGPSINTNCLKCDRVVELKAGSTYPVYGGLVTGARVLQSSNHTVELLYMSPSSSDWELVSYGDATVGNVTECSSSSGLRLNTQDSIVIGGASGVALIVIIGVVVVILVVIRRKRSGTRKDESMSHAHDHHVHNSGKARKSESGSGKKRYDKGGNAEVHYRSRSSRSGSGMKRSIQGGNAEVLYRSSRSGSGMKKYGKGGNGEVAYAPGKFAPDMRILRQNGNARVPYAPGRFPPDMRRFDQGGNAGVLYMSSRSGSGMKKYGKGGNAEVHYRSRSRSSRSGSGMKRSSKGGSGRGEMSRRGLSKGGPDNRGRPVRPR